MSLALRIRPALVGLIAVAFSNAAANTLTVTNLNDGGAGSLRDTIAASANGDTIVFGVNGTVQITSASLTINKSITIDGTGTFNRVVIEHANINLNTLIEITSPGVDLLNLDIARFSGHRGVGISVILGADAGFQNCRIRGFRRGLSNAGVSTLFDCEIVGNRMENTTTCQPIVGVGISNSGLLLMRRSSLFDK